jgi:hypothetical protein
MTRPRDNRGVNTEGWHETDVVAKLASTRPTTLTTGERVVIARSALENMAEQISSGFVPMTVEHLSMFPPVGRWYAAEIVRADDGSDELIAHARFLKRLHPIGADPDPWYFVSTAGTLSDPPAAVEIEAVSFEPRGFDRARLEEFLPSAPVKVVEEARWSTLPPIEWALSIPVIWGATRFLGSFLDTLGREAAVSLGGWLRQLSDAAKDPERDRILALRFVISSGPLIVAFIPISEAEDFEKEALAALDAAGIVAELAGAQSAASVLGDVREAAFLWADGTWHLAWWVADDDAVRVTNWFLANEPDPSRFLGRPLLPDSDAPA